MTIHLDNLYAFKKNVIIVIVCARTPCIFVGACAMVCLWRLENKFVELALSFHLYLDSVYQAQVTTVMLKNVSSSEQDF